MFLNSYNERPHEVEAPPVQPVSRVVRASRILIWILVVVALGGLTAGSWWYFTVVRPNKANDSANRIVNSTLQEDTAAAKVTVTARDSDGDSLDDEVEVLYGTEVGKIDSDGDGFSDGEEVKNGYQPLIAAMATRMIDTALIDIIAKSVAQPLVLSSGISVVDHERYYYVYDGASTAYFGADGTLAVQCSLGDVKEKCTSLPNALHTDFSRTYKDKVATDSFHIPY